MSSKKIKKEVKQTAEIYTVEKIVGKQTQKGKTKYLVKWDGYSNEENTWEPEENILCPVLILEYEKSRKSKPTKADDRPKAIRKKIENKSVNSGFTPLIIKEEPMEVDLPDAIVTELPTEDATIPPVEVKTEPSEVPVLQQTTTSKHNSASKRNSVSKPKTLEPGPPSPRPIDQGAVVGLVPEKILAATELHSEMVFRVICPGGQQAYITSKSAREHFPQMVIDFYESISEWE